MQGGEIREIGLLGDHCPSRAVILEVWLACEIWLKSAGLTSQLKLAFYNFFAGSRCNW